MKSGLNASKDPTSHFIQDIPEINHLELASSSMVLEHHSYTYSYINLT